MKGDEPLGANILINLLDYFLLKPDNLVKTLLKNRVHIFHILPNPSGYYNNNPDEI